MAKIERKLAVSRDEYNRRIEKLLKHARKRSNLTQRDIGDRLSGENEDNLSESDISLNRSVSTINRLEKGMHIPDPWKLKKYARAYKLTDEEIDIWNGMLFGTSKYIGSDATFTASESLPLFTFTKFPPAKRLLEPLLERSLYQTFSDPQMTPKFGPISFPEVAIIEEALKGSIWSHKDIGWFRHPDPFILNPFWKELDDIDKIGPFDASDQAVGRHIRIAAAGRMRHPDPFCIGLLWQPISWEQSRKIKRARHP